MKEKVRQAFTKVFGNKKSAKDLTAEEMNQVAAAYKEMHDSDMFEDLEKEKENELKASQLDAVAKALSEEKSAEAAEGEVKPEASVPEAVTKLIKENESLKKENKEKDAKIIVLGSTLEPDKPQSIEISMKAFGNNHTASHLFGIDHPAFSLEKRWNRLMIDPSMKSLSDAEYRDVRTAFEAETMSYGRDLAKRYQHLQATGNLPKKGSSFTQTTTGLADAGLGSQFVVMRQDALIARILELPNVYDIFPKRFGIQDRELMTNAFFGDFSQAYQTGAVYKGSMELQPEMGYVDDTMFKTLFESMKWLERVYIGYLNQDGSDPLKWSLIEWTLLNIATKLTMEQYERRITGIYVKPLTGAAGHYLHGSTGFIYTLIRYIHENKLLAFSDAALATYDNTSTNMVDAVIAFYDKLKESVPNFQEGQYEMLLNKNHQYWYRSQVRAKFGLQSDFSGPIDSVVPDTQMKITWVPNMGKTKLISVTKPGNFQCLENLPGEMFGIQFHTDMEAVKAWSTWKEGFAGSFVGKKFASIAALTANAYALQEVFMNKPVTDLAANATSADAANNFWFKSVQNGQATDFLDVANAVDGVAYILECGHLTNATTVTKIGGKFTEITGNWTPSAIGDYLMFSYDTATSKFLELERKVAGTRTVNADRQPNVK